jgi:hypothetical protein
MAPTKKRREAGEIGIGGDPFAAALDRQRCVDRVRHEFAFHLSVFAELAKDGKVAFARPNYRARWQFD